MNAIMEKQQNMWTISQEIGIYNKHIPGFVDSNPTQVLGTLIKGDYTLLLSNFVVGITFKRIH